MTDQESTPQGGQEPAPATEPKEGQAPQGEQPKTFDADYVKSLRSEAAKWRTEAQQRQEHIEELEERDKSELEKLQSKLSKTEKRAAEAEAKLLRYEVAKEKEVPADAIDLLNGSSREELEAAADKILDLVKSRTEKDDKPDFDGGAREPAPEPKAPEQAHSDLVLSLLGVKPSN